MQTITSTQAAQQLEPVAYSTVIRPQDFRRYTDDKHRDEWTAELLRYVVEALDGAPVAITVDRATGHTLVGARLVRATDDYRYGMYSPRLRVETVLADGSTQITDYRVDSIGDAILPLSETTGKGAKWQALDLARAGGFDALAHRPRPRS